MCYSKAEGGGRCSAHARQALDKAVEAYAAHRESDVNGDPADSVARRDEGERLRNEVAARRFDYATTPEGSRLAKEDIAHQQGLVDAVRANGPASGSPGSTAWLNSEENLTLRAMNTTQRSADGVREAQDAARVRHAEVKAGNVGEQTAKALAEEQDKIPENRSVQDYNGYWHGSTVIGVIAVDEPFERVDAKGEVAAWSTTHQVKPGIYPVSKTDTGDLTWTYDTTITDEYKPPLLGGVPMGPGRKDDVGKDGRLGGRTYTFSAPSAYTPGTKFGGGSLVLRKGVSMGYEVSKDRGDGQLAPTKVTVKEATDTEPQRNQRFIDEDNRRAEHQAAARRAEAERAAQVTS